MQVEDDKVPQPGSHSQQSRKNESQKLEAVHVAEFRAEQEITKRLHEAYMHIQRGVNVARHEEHASQVQSHAFIISALEAESYQTQMMMARVQQVEYGIHVRAGEWTAHTHELEAPAYRRGQQTTLEEAVAQHKAVVERLESSALAHHQAGMMRIMPEAQEELAQERLRIEQTADQEMRAELAEAQRRLEHAEARTTHLAHQGMSSLATELEERERVRAKAVEDNARAHLDAAERRRILLLEEYEQERAEERQRRGHSSSKPLRLLSVLVTLSSRCTRNSTKGQSLPQRPLRLLQDLWFLSSTSASDLLKRRRPRKRRRARSTSRT
jgi:hypothetical protein